VYTAAGELERGLRPELAVPADLPTGYVRLVYSLGYGENELLDRRVGNNGGTPQYWKIFKSCVTRVGEPVDCASLQRSMHTAAVLRLRSKLAVLSALRQRGIWLVDASVAALNRPGQSRLTSKQKVAALRASWDVWTRTVVHATQPQAVLVVGVGVVRWLRERLDATGIPWAGVPQPQAPLTRECRREILGTYSALCEDPKRIRLVRAV
jgi:hypothetical protein